MPPAVTSVSCQDSSHHCTKDFFFLICCHIVACYNVNSFSFWFLLLFFVIKVFLFMCPLLQTVKLGLIFLRKEKWYSTSSQSWCPWLAWPILCGSAPVALAGCLSPADGNSRPPWSRELRLVPTMLVSMRDMQGCPSWIDLCKNKDGCRGWGGHRPHCGGHRHPAWVTGRGSP